MLKMKVLERGTTIQELFSNYVHQYLNEKGEVFVKPDVVFDKGEEVRKIVNDTERLLERLKVVESDIEFLEGLQSALINKKDNE